MKVRIAVNLTILVCAVVAVAIATSIALAVIHDVDTFSRYYLGLALEVIAALITIPDIILPSKTPTISRLARRTVKKVVYRLSPLAAILGVAVLLAVERVFLAALALFVCPCLIISIVCIHAVWADLFNYRNPTSPL